MPTNCDMKELAAAFEAAGVTDVLTVLGSGNVVFTSDERDLDTLTRRLERAMQARLGRVFTPFVRTLDALEALVAADPFAAFDVPDGDKRDVTFLRAPSSVRPPPPRAGAAVLGVRGAEVFSHHTPRHPDGPVFMKLLAEAFGDEITTRTWDTVKKVLAKR